MFGKDASTIYNKESSMRLSMKNLRGKYILQEVILMTVIEVLTLLLLVFDVLSYIEDRSSHKKLYLKKGEDDSHA